MINASPSRDARDEDALSRALQTERDYFELGAKVEPLDGAVLAWTPAFVTAPAASVIHRVEPGSITGREREWLADAESRLVTHGILLARVYLNARHPGLERCLADAGYACREELIFTDNLPEPPSFLTFRPVRTDADWANKRAFHQDVPESPDGHGQGAADLAGLERHKCGHGMEAFIAEIDGETVGVAGAIWGESVVRIKNLLIHPDHRRRSVATALLCHIAALGRARGIHEQCIVALVGGAGEMVYRALNMRMVGSCFEWSRMLGSR